MLRRWRQLRQEIKTIYVFLTICPSAHSSQTSKIKIPHLPRKKARDIKRSNIEGHRTSPYVVLCNHLFPGRSSLHHVLAKSPDSWFIASPPPSQCARTSGISGGSSPFTVAGPFRILTWFLWPKHVNYSVFPKLNTIVWSNNCFCHPSPHLKSYRDSAPILRESIL